MVSWRKVSEMEETALRFLLVKKPGSTDDEPGKSAKLAIGLEGGIGGFAGDVSVETKGISRPVRRQLTVSSQSVGGGGGNGGSASLGSKSPMASGTQAYGLAVGGTGGEGGIGGAVAVDNAAVVLTQGQGSIGLLAQSVGGGGGSGGKSMNTARLKIMVMSLSILAELEALVQAVATFLLVSLEY